MVLTTPEARFLHGQTLRGHCVKLYKWSLVEVKTLKISEIPELWDICQGELWNQSNQKKHATAGNTWSALQTEYLSLLMPDMELQEFALLAFSLSLVQYFFTMSPFLLFGMLMHILYYCLFEGVSFVFVCLFVCYQGVIDKWLPLSLIRDFEPWVSSVANVKDYGEF